MIGNKEEKPIRSNHQYFFQMITCITFFIATLTSSYKHIIRTETPVFIYFSLYEQLPPTFWMIIHCKHNRHLVFILKQSHQRDLKYDKELILRICKLFFLWSDLRHMSLPPIQRMNVHLPINSVCPNSCPPRVRLPAELDGQQITHRI